MWAQIKKKWVRKKGQIWINQHEKEVNADKYVNNLIEQGYMKHYEKYEHSQQKLQSNLVELLARKEKVVQYYLHSLLFE